MQSIIRAFLPPEFLCMKWILFTALFLRIFESAGAQQIQVIDRWQQLDERLKAGGDTTFLVNFWATWCKPCVDELPLFESFAARQHAKPVKVILVSLDFKGHVTRRVVPFIAEKNLRNEVLVLADQDTNIWMAQVNEKWDGAIPATLVVRSDRRYFVQKQFKSAQDLELLLQQVR